MTTEEDRKAKKREQQRRWNARRYEKETPEAKEKRLEKGRAAAKQRYQEMTAEGQTKPSNYPQRVKKPGRLMALAGWHRW